MRNICEKCGGTTGAFASRVVNTLNMLGQRAHVCPGHIEEKHDGKLDEDENYSVSHSTERSNGRFHYVYIEGKLNLGDDEISLTPPQALSLLAWLKQEEATLEQLAKEQ